MAAWAQHWRKRISENWRNGVIGAASAVLLGLGFLWTPEINTSLVGLSYDIPLILRPSVRPEEATIVYMDEASRKALAPGIGRPWHRSLHTRLLARLTEFGAKAVVFDVLMDDPWPTNAVEEPADRAARVDVDLASAMRAHGKVLLAGRAEVVTDSVNLVTTHTPTEPLLSAAAGWGVVEFDRDPDDKIRRVAYGRLLQGYTNLACRTVEVLGRTLPTNRFETRWLNFYGPAYTLPHCSYHQVLESNGVPRQLLAGKVVFVGDAPVIGTRGVTGDFRPTAVGNLAGVEIQATAFLNLWRGEWLRELSRWSQCGLVVLVGGLCGFVYCLVRPSTATGLAGLSFVAVSVAGVLLVWHRLTWFPWLTIGAVQIPVALGWAVLANTRKVYHEKEALEKTLATAHLDPAAAPPAANPADLSRTLIVPQAPGPKPLPRIMADHELVKFVGGGAYGEVWLARNAIGLYRAFKIIRRDKFRDDAPFQREFRGLEKFMPISMGHPGLVKVLHVGKNDAEGFFYYTMEAGDDQVTGPQINPDNYAPKNLTTEYRRRGTVPVIEAIDLMVPLCEALDYLHRQSLVHRDIKPSNIIFVHGAPKLADIGLVADISENRDISWVGTDGYIPPEGPGTPGADLYALGKVLYEITFGQDSRNWPAFPTTLIQGGRQAELFALNVVLLRACAEQRGRYKSALEMRDDLLRLRAELAGAGPTRV